MHAPVELGDILVFLVAAGVAAPLLHRVRISPIVAFLLIGLVIGPYGLGRLVEHAPWLSLVAIENDEPAHALAKIGVVLLLFLIGLEISAPRLWSMRKLVFGLGLTQIVVTAGAVGAIAAGFGNPPAAAFAIGAAFALSSTAVVLQLLTDRRQLSGPTGRAALAVLLAQDLAVAPVLVTLQILGGDGGGSVFVAFAKAAGLAAVVVGGIMAAGRLGARPFLHMVAGARAPELFTAAVLLMIVATAAATAQAGLSLELGAFLAGLLLAETEYRHEIEVSLAPFKGLFLGLFFMSVGMSVDLAKALDQPFWLPVSLAALIALKAAIAIPAARAFGVRAPAAVETGLLLSTGGEFAFVIFATAGGLDLLSSDTAQFMTLLAGLSIVVTPFIAAPARRIAKALETRTLATSAGVPASDELEGHVILIGYGRVGRMLSAILCDERVPHIALDADAGLVAQARAAGAGVYFGDAAKVDILRRLGVERAAALVVTMDSERAAEAVVEAARRARPNLTVLARARDAAHARRLLAHGADQVVPEALEASLDLAETLLRDVGLSDEAAYAVVDARRRAEREALRDQPGDVV